MKTRFNNATQEYELIRKGSLIASHPYINVIDVIKTEIKDSQLTTKKLKT